MTDVDLFLVHARTVAEAYTDIQRVPALHAFWDLEKTVLNEIRVSGTVVNPPTNVKIPHLHVHKPKTVVVETVLVIFV